MKCALITQPRLFCPATIRNLLVSRYRIVFPALFRLVGPWSYIVSRILRPSLLFPGIILLLTSKGLFYRREYLIRIRLCSTMHVVVISRTVAGLCSIVVSYTWNRIRQYPERIYDHMPGSKKPGSVGDFHQVFLINFLKFVAQPWLVPRHTFLVAFS